MVSGDRFSSGRVTSYGARRGGVMKRSKSSLFTVLFVALILVAAARSAAVYGASERRLEDNANQDGYLPMPDGPVEHILLPVLLGGYSSEGPVPQGYLEAEDLVVSSLGPGIAHRWTLNLTPGDVFTISAAPGPAADIFLSLFDSDGLIYQQNMSPAGEVETIADLSISEQGDYDLVVQTIQGEPTGYALMFLDQDSYSLVLRGTLQDGDIRTDSLPEDVDHFWFFEALSGQHVSFTITPKSSGDPFIELFDPDGSRMLTIDDKGEGEPESLEHYELPAGGLYGIRVAEFDFQEMAYEIVISLP